MTLLVARVLPAILRALHDEHDLFLITSVATGLTLAGIGAVVFGVPLALAAFVGGLAVTDSREAAEARRRLLPFRDVFAVLFFVAIGTLVDPAGSWRGCRGSRCCWRWWSWRRSRSPGASPRSPDSRSGRASSRSASARWASSASCWRRPRWPPGAIDAVLYVEVIAAVAVSIAISTVVVRYVPPGVQRDPPVVKTAVT